MKFRAVGIVVVLATATVACRGDDFEPLPSPPTAVSTSTISPGSSGSPLAPPTGSPGVTGNLNVGTASVTTTGGLNATATYDELFTPGIWTLPPGAISLSWRGARKQSLSITGPSFTAQLPTDIDLVLQFSVLGPTGVVEFRSSAGECLVTISPALADQLGGNFTCVGLTNGDGTMTVNAQGTFSAE
jgi:hypothetical protein